MYKQTNHVSKSEEFVYEFVDLLGLELTATGRRRVLERPCKQVSKDCLERRDRTLVLSVVLGVDNDAREY